MRGLIRAILLVVAAATLWGCGAAEPVWAPQEEVTRARYEHPGPTSLTLYTVINNGSGAGAHTALLVNGSQRVVFDPAGTFYHPQLPERNDVHYGMSPAALDFYIDYHARVTYHVVEQTIVVSPQVAELALQRVQAYGAVAKAQCAASTSEVLRGIPGFEGMPKTMSPKKLMAAFAQLPGVTERTIYDDSPDIRGQLVDAPVLR